MLTLPLVFQDGIVSRLQFEEEARGVLHVFITPFKKNSDKSARRGLKEGEQEHSCALQLHVGKFQSGRPAAWR